MKGSKPIVSHRDPHPRVALLLRLAVLLGLAGLPFTGGCASVSPPPLEPAPPIAAEDRTILESDARTRPIVAVESGQQLQWIDLLRAIAWADVVILGERHDDGVAHEVQRLIVKDVLETWPRSALAMEMFERDEQVLVDDYLDDVIDRETLMRLTFSANWGGKDRWMDWYQPIVDEAKDRGARVIAANAPRRYVRMARTHGYDALRAIPRERRRFFDLPRRLPEGTYRERFWDVMSHAHPTSDEEQAAADARIESIFRSQLVWDATMARSILSAGPSRRAKVVHLVGQFHSDFDGGLIIELRRHRPNLRILNISLQAADAIERREEDRGRADIVIYTGAIERAAPVVDEDDRSDAHDDHPDDPSH